MAGFDARLWRILRRVWLILAVGVLGLLLGLGSRPERGDSVFGLFVVLLVCLPIAAMVWRMPAPARSALARLPRHRPVLSFTAAVLALVTALVLCWTVTNAIWPGSFSPLSLALLGVVVAGVSGLLGGRLTRR